MDWEATWRAQKVQGHLCRLGCHHDFERKQIPCKLSESYRQNTHSAQGRSCQGCSEGRRTLGTVCFSLRTLLEPGMALWPTGNRGRKPHIMERAMWVSPGGMWLPEGGSHMGRTWT